MKQKLRTITTAVLICFAFSLCACVPLKENENHHTTIRFVNISDVPIYVNRISPLNDQDTIYRIELGSMMVKTDIYKIYPDTENRDALWRRGYYEDILPNKAQRHSDKTMVFVFDSKQLEANPSDINSAIIQRYYLSLDDLRTVNWTLTYPPTPIMSEMKMYPPYKQK